MDFELLLKYDKKIEEVNNILKKLKEKRDSIESELIHKYKNVEAPIKVNNMIITCSNIDTMPPLSMKMLSLIFDKIFDNDNKTKIVNVINNYRHDNKKSSIVLKRKLIKNKSTKNKKNTV